MFNDERTPLDKALGSISILSNPDIAKIKKVAGIYDIPFKTIMALISPVTVCDRVVYLTKEKAARVEETQKRRAQWSKKKSHELKSHIPHVYTNKKHSRQVVSSNVTPGKDLDSKETRRKIISDITENKKDNLNQKWERHIKSSAI